MTDNLLPSTDDLKQLLTAGKEDLFQLLLHHDEQVLLALLSNRNLDEEHLLTLLKRRDLSENLINSIYKLQRNHMSHRLRQALVKNPHTPGALIRNLLPHLRLFELVDICHLPGMSPDLRLAAEQNILHRLPTTPLGNKITLARRGSSTVVAALVKEGQPQVIDACLGNSRLHEAALFQFLNSAAAQAETISMIARHQRWKERPNLKQAILKNPHTPSVWLTLWLPRVNIQQLKQLRMYCKRNPAKRQLIDDEFKKRGLK